MLAGQQRQLHEAPEPPPGQHRLSTTDAVRRPSVCAIVPVACYACLCIFDCGSRRLCLRTTYRSRCLLPPLQIHVDNPLRLGLATVTVSELVLLVPGICDLIEAADFQLGEVLLRILPYLPGFGPCVGDADLRVGAQC